MRKRILSAPSPEAAPLDERWLDLENLAEVEVTSERPDLPVEAALLPHREGGWRAAASGAQTIRLRFDSPQQVRRIHLVFIEEALARTQEFTLRWHPGSNEPLHEIVRQQFHFSPPGTCREVEDYRVDLEAVQVLELTIIPDISRGESHASLAQMRLA